MELIGLYFVAAALLVVAGAAKTARPAETARALGAVLPLPPVVRRPTRLREIVRVVAALECALGAVGLVWPGSLTGALIAVSYFGFAAVSVVVRSRGGALASCGCLGRPDTPVTAVHVAVDLGLGVAALAVAVSSPPGWIVRVLVGQPGRGVPLVVASLVATWLALLVMDELSRLVAMRRLVGVTHRRVRAPGGGTP